MKLEIKEIMYGGRCDEITSIIFKNEKGGTTQSFMNEDVYLFGGNAKEIYSYLHENSRKKFNVFPINEEMTIKFALDRDEIEKMGSSIEIDEMYDKVRYINIVVYEQDGEKFEGIYPWILIELPKPEGDIKYVPILITNNYKGKKLVCVHPDYHKVFIRAFTEKERHSILGFIYLYGPYMAAGSQYCYEKKERFNDHDRKSNQMDSNYFKDRKAPLRIPTFKCNQVKGITYDFIIDEYEEWLKENFNPDGSPKYVKERVIYARY